jgi:hypothetical protein
MEQPMTFDLAGLQRDLTELEQRVEASLKHTGGVIQDRIEQQGIKASIALSQEHARVKTSALAYLRGATWPTLLTAPVIYGMIVPIALLDLCVIGYQAVCFRVWGVRRVKRSGYILIDRQSLAYLNAIEKLNCLYCGYANGVIAFAREVASRTEQYWCPIKHATRPAGVHDRYRDFVAFGDAKGWKARLGELRRKIG